MANHFFKILDVWHQARDQQQWVLATIVDTQGSSYRKIGAQMMINDLGQYYGLLSGGCLESDIMLQARRCWLTNKNKIVQYDMREEEDLAWKLGIGCGGLVKILLQPVHQDNQYLGLDRVFDALKVDQFCLYRQRVDENTPCNHWSVHLSRRDEAVSIEAENQQIYLQQQIAPPYHLAIFGAGVDARPVVAIAAALGWQISLIDPRITHARANYFPGVTRIVKTSPESLSQADWLVTTDAAILMNHSLDLDAKALTLIADKPIRYLGVLGPIHRTDRVFALAGMARSELKVPLANPVGLRLGGELPESIALSMIAEIHAFLEHGDGKSISQVLG